MLSQTSVIRKVPIQPPSSTTRFDIPPLGYCFKFSKGAECAVCQYKHLCYKCEGSHPPNLVFSVSVVKPQKPLPRLLNPQSRGHSQNVLPKPVKVDRRSFFCLGTLLSLQSTLFQVLLSVFPLIMRANESQAILKI